MAWRKMLRPQYLLHCNSCSETTSRRNLLWKHPKHHSLALKTHTFKIRKICRSPISKINKDFTINRLKTATVSPINELIFYQSFKLSIISLKTRSVYWWRSQHPPKLTLSLRWSPKIWRRRALSTVVRLSTKSDGWAKVRGFSGHVGYVSLSCAICKKSPESKANCDYTSKLLSGSTRM